MNNIQETNGKFKENQRLGIKYFIKMCKYDVMPSILAGGGTSILLAKINSPSGLYDAFLFGGVSALALAMAVNASVTGIKMRKDQKEKVLEDVINNGQEEVKHL